MNKNYRVHPGVVMKSILVSLGRNQKWLADEMRMNKTVISNIIHGKRKVTKAIAVSFENATGYPASNLLKAQIEYDLFCQISSNSSIEKAYKFDASYDLSSDDSNYLLAI